MAFKARFFGSLLKHGIIAVGCTSVLFGGYFTVKGDESFYRNIIMPAVRLLDAERAHVMAVKLAAKGLIPQDYSSDPNVLETNVFGLKFSNPVGLAAGFDKDGEAVDGLLKTGFGFVEIGSITPLPQIGNDMPRVFRLVEDKAVINRYGFNSDGHSAVHQRLQEQFRRRGHPNGILGINLGKNKTSDDAVADYVKGIQCFSGLADYLVINVSSPNTPGLRAMQGRHQLAELIDKVLEARRLLPNEIRRPLLVKIAPDLSKQDREDIAIVVTRKNSRVDGIIVTNTTLSRPDDLRSTNKIEKGGLSGKPLCNMSTQTISEMYKLTEGKLPIIGVGGIFSGKDAYEKVQAGASLVQLYTAFAYEGPPVVKKVKKELAELLRKDGFTSIDQAVGSAHKKKDLI